MCDHSADVAVLALAGSSAAEVTTRTCRVCSNAFPLTADYFTRDKTQPAGLYYTCKPCARERRNAANRARRASDRERGASPRTRRSPRGTAASPADTALARQRAASKAFRSLCKVARSAACVQHYVGRRHATAAKLAEYITDLVALVLEHGDRGLTLSDLRLLPEAFETALRYSEGHPAPLGVDHRDTWGPTLVTFHLPRPTREAYALAREHGTVSAIVDPADVDTELAAAVHGRIVGIQSLCVALGVPCPVSSVHSWTDAVAQKAAIERLMRMVPDTVTVFEAPATFDCEEVYATFLTGLAA
jgi:hypothetical protein